MDKDCSVLFLVSLSVEFRIIKFSNLHRVTYQTFSVVPTGYHLYRTDCFYLKAPHWNFSLKLGLQEGTPERWCWGGNRPSCPLKNGLIMLFFHCCILNCAVLPSKSVARRASLIARFIICKCRNIIRNFLPGVFVFYEQLDRLLHLIRKSQLLVCILTILYGCLVSF